MSSLSEKAAPLTSSAIEQASKALEEASPVVKSSLDAAAPVVSDAATKIVAAAKPAGEAAIKALADQGVDTATVTFRCQHSFHRCCVPQMACLLCFERNFCLARSTKSRSNC